MVMLLIVFIKYTRLYGKGEAPRRASPKKKKKERYRLRIVLARLARQLSEKTAL